jgi:hypothetical protein
VKRMKKKKEDPEQSDRARRVRVALALTADEYARLEAAASAEGLPVGTYARVVLCRALRAQAGPPSASTTTPQG